MILTFGFDVMIFFSRFTFLIIAVFLAVVAVFVVDWASGGKKSSSERPSHGSYCLEQSEKPEDASDELLPDEMMIIVGHWFLHHSYLYRTNCPIVCFPIQYCDHTTSRLHSLASLRSSPWFSPFFFSASEQEMVSRSNLKLFSGVLTERGVIPFLGKDSLPSSILLRANGCW